MRFNLRRPTPTRADHRPTKKEVTAAVTLSVTQWVAAVAGTKWRAFVEQSGRKHARGSRADLWYGEIGHRHRPCRSCRAGGKSRPATGNRRVGALAPRARE